MKKKKNVPKMFFLVANYSWPTKNLVIMVSSFAGIHPWGSFNVTVSVDKETKKVFRKNLSSHFEGDREGIQNRLYEKLTE